MTQWLRARGLQALEPEDLPWTPNSHIFFFDKLLSIIFFICKLNIMKYHCWTGFEELVGRCL